MSLQNCRECGREISTFANKCPDCDTPDPTRSSSVRDTAVQNCRECGRNVSTYAATCPDCGIPEPTRSRSGRDQPTTSRFSRGKVAAVLGTALIVWVAIALNSDTRGGEHRPSSAYRGGGGSPAVTSAMTVDEQISALEHGSMNPPRELVRRFTRALDRAERKCTQSRRMVSDMAVKGQEILVEGGRPDVRLIEIVEGIDRAVPAEMAPADCAEIIGAVVAMMVR